MDANPTLIFVFFLGVRIMSTNDKLFEQLENTANMSVFAQMEQADQFSAISFSNSISNGIINERSIIN